jgi:hypothetical protein
MPEPAPVMTATLPFNLIAELGQNNPYGDFMSKPGTDLLDSYPGMSGCYCRYFADRVCLLRYPGGSRGALGFVSRDAH